MTLLIIFQNNFVVEEEPEEPTIVIDTDDSYQVISFYCNLTGSQNSLDDIILPFSIFQSRKRQSEPTYLSITIPTLDYIDEISAREDGNIEIYTRNEKIIESDITSIRYDAGSRNQSVTLTGYKTTTFTAKEIDMSDYPIEYKSFTDGKIRYRLKKASTLLNPGDTVTINDDTFIVDNISYYVTSNMQQIEIQSV